MPGSEPSPDEYLTCTLRDAGSSRAVLVAQGQYKTELDLISAFRLVRVGSCCKMTRAKKRICRKSFLYFEGSSIQKSLDAIFLVAWGIGGKSSHAYAFKGT